MIKWLKLFFGSSNDVGPLEINPEPITILVGPNNSGKSLALREIETLCRSGPQVDRKVVAELALDIPDPDQAVEELKAFKLKPARGQAVPAGQILVGVSNPGQGVGQTYVSPDQLRNVLLQVRSDTAVPMNSLSYISQYFLSFFTVRLDGRTRFSLTQPQGSGDLLGPPQNHLMSLFQDAEARMEVRRIVEDAFGFYFVIDPTGMTTLRVKMSEREPVGEAEEQSWDEQARSFHEAAEDVLDLSDGVQAFTGIVAAVLSAKFKIVLIDEPEAFLAPRLANKLGNELATLAQRREGSLFAATHSADFLMGCVQAGADVNIARLTYRNGVATARLLQAETLLRLMRDPLLRSTNVLDALFYESVIVTEADTDRAFYQEINERLLSFGRKGIGDCLFLNARSKQTVQQLAGPLRSIGIPVAMIVDIDILKEGGQVWTNLLNAANLPQTSRNSLNSLRADVKRKFDESGKEMKRDGGMDILDEDAREACENLLDQLTEYGIFVVPNGEVESWLPELGATGHGPGWLIQIFERMGSNPADAGYAKPYDGDVWTFCERIGQWFDNEDRKGIPE